MPIFYTEINWFWYGLIALVSYLMVSTLPMMALKFDKLTMKNSLPKLLLLVVAIIGALFLKWQAVPIVFVFYVALSLAMPNYSKGEAK